MAAEANILLADDDDVGRYVVATMLRRAGFTVREAVDGAEAVDEARREPPDVAILDVKMPVMDGFEACRRLKGDDATSHLPVLLLSATFLESDAQVEGLEKGADAYLTQPVEAPVLAATVRSLLRARRAETGQRAAALQWRTTFDAISDAVAVVDADLLLQRVNRSFGALFGQDAGVLVGRPLVEVSPYLAQLAASAWDGVEELEIDGRVLAVRRDAIPGEAEPSTPGEVVITLTDVTAARVAEIQRAEALAREREISLTLQKSLLPERLPERPGLTFDAWHFAAEKELIVGGDWYDVIDRDDSVWLVIGDVAGHGVAAAAQAGQLRHSLRVYAHEGFSLSAAIARLNDLVLDTRLTGMATVCIVAIEPETGRLRMVRAGHPPPLLVPAGGPPRLLEGIPGIVLGVPNAVCDEYETALSVGDRLVLYTDGLVERPREPLDVRLEELVRIAGGTDGLPALRLQLVERMVDVDDLRDDVALLLAERR